LIHINEVGLPARHISDSGFPTDRYRDIKEVFVMTQHILQEHAEEDKQIMRRLFTVVGAFIVATAVMGITVAAIFG